jgi:hypothetical protein
MIFAFLLSLSFFYSNCFAPPPKHTSETSKFALLFCGGGFIDTNREGFLADLTAVYKSLLAFGLPKENIRVCYLNGAIYEFNGGKMSPLFQPFDVEDIATSVDARIKEYSDHLPIDVAASRDGLKKVSQEFLAKIPDKSDLVVYMTDHGTRTHDNKATEIIGANGEQIKMADWKQTLAPLKDKDVRMSIFTDICFGGGVAQLSDDFSKAVVFATQVPYEVSMSHIDRIRLKEGKKSFAMGIAEKLGSANKKVRIRPIDLISGSDDAELAYNFGYSTMHMFLDQNREQIEAQYQKLTKIRQSHVKTSIFSLFRGCFNSNNPVHISGPQPLFKKMSSLRHTKHLKPDEIDQLEQKQLDLDKKKYNLSQLEEFVKKLDENWEENFTRQHDTEKRWFHMMNLLGKEYNRLEITSKDLTSPPEAKSQEEKLRLFMARCTEVTGYNEMRKSIHKLEYEILEKKLRLGADHNLLMRYEQILRLENDPF